MQEAITASILASLFYGALGVGVWWGLLRLLDINGGQRFKDLWGVLKSNPNALARYLGWRAVAVAIIVSAFIR